MEGFVVAPVHPGHECKRPGRDNQRGNQGGIELRIEFATPLPFGDDVHQSGNQSTRHRIAKVLRNVRARPHKLTCQHANLRRAVQPFLVERFGRTADTFGGAHGFDVDHRIDLGGDALIELIHQAEFAVEIAEEGRLADAGGLTDVIDRDFGVAAGIEQ